MGRFRFVLALFTVYSPGYAVGPQLADLERESEQVTMELYQKFQKSHSSAVDLLSEQYIALTLATDLNSESIQLCSENVNQVFEELPDSSARMQPIQSNPNTLSEITQRYNTQDSSLLSGKPFQIFNSLLIGLSRMSNAENITDSAFRSTITKGLLFHVLDALHDVKDIVTRESFDLNQLPSVFLVLDKLAKAYNDATKMKVQISKLTLAETISQSTVKANFTDPQSFYDQFMTTKCSADAGSIPYLRAGTDDKVIEHIASAIKEIRVYDDGHGENSVCQFVLADLAAPFRLAYEDYLSANFANGAEIKSDVCIFLKSLKIPCYGVGEITSNLKKSVKKMKNDLNQLQTLNTDNIFNDLEAAITTNIDLVKAAVKLNSTVDLEEEHLTNLPAVNAVASLPAVVVKDSNETEKTLFGESIYKMFRGVSLSSLIKSAIYQVSVSPTWNAAHDYCAGIGKQLPVPADEDDVKLLSDLVAARSGSTRGYWVGLYKQNDTWTDYYTGQPSIVGSYQNEYGQNCGAVYGGNKNELFDFYCDRAAATTVYDIMCV